MLCAHTCQIMLYCISAYAKSVCMWFIDITRYIPTNSVEITFIISSDAYCSSERDSNLVPKWHGLLYLNLRILAS